MFRQKISSEVMVVGGIMIALALIISYASEVVNWKATAAITSSSTVLADNIPNPFDNVSITAQSAYVYDLKTGTMLYEKDADVVRPLASLTKLMTALVASEELSTSSVVTITQEALDQDGSNGLVLGERFTFKNLLNFTLMVSSNAGAAAIAEAAAPTSPTEFITDMNSKANELGFNSLLFYNPTGLDVSTAESGGYGSAKDISNLFIYILSHNPDILSNTKYPSGSFTSLNGIVHTISNTDVAIPHITDIIASKTGYTDLAGGNVIVTFDEDIGHPILITILGSTFDGRFTDAETLASTTMAYFTSHDN